ncbi:MAG: ferritin family protein [Planctomycetota bacterium]|jgi:rubrerythrin
MNLEEAIKTALDFENKVFRTYKDAEDRAADPVAKKIFGVLAKEEAGHIKYLNDRFKEWKEGGTLTVEKLDTVVPSQEKIRQGMEAMKGRVETKQSVNPADVELLERAIQAEEETAGFYRRMVSELDAGGRKLFARFVEIEEGHVAIVRAEHDSVTGAGYWFDMPEWQFTGG